MAQNICSPLKNLTKWNIWWWHIKSLDDLKPSHSMSLNAWETFFISLLPANMASWKITMLNRRYIHLQTLVFPLSSYFFRGCDNSWWLNQPSEKHACQIGSSPKGSGWKSKNMWKTHHPDSQSGKNNHSIFIQLGAFQATFFNQPKLL